MIIQCDTRQKRKHHEAKEEYFKSQGYELVNARMLVGDYGIPSNGSVAVDTKADIRELYSNLIHDHERFRNECILAQKAGIKLYILIENKDGIKAMNDIMKWWNPQLRTYQAALRKAQRTGHKPPKPPTSNKALLKVMYTMNEKYGVEFVFCSPNEAGAKVLELLGARNDERTSD